MTTEYELDCANCGASLTRTEVAGDSLGVFAGESLNVPAETVEVAECPDCGGRYFPETTLKRLEI